MLLLVQGNFKNVNLNINDVKKKLEEELEYKTKIYNIFVFFI